MQEHGLQMFFQEFDKKLFTRKKMINILVKVCYQPLINENPKTVGMPITMIDIPNTNKILSLYLYIFMSTH